MRREYKGFSIEDQARRFGSGRARRSYTIYHVVTGNCAGTFDRIQDAKDEIDAIHTDATVYASYAGCKANNLERFRNRYRYIRNIGGTGK